jgi:hypothetical protein
MGLGIVLSLCSSALALAQEKRPTLEEAIAEADRLDPNWKLDDLIAKQRNIPDEENSALVVADIYKDLTKVWKIPKTDAKRPLNPPEPTTLDELWLNIPGFLSQPDHKPTEPFLRLLDAHQARFAPFVLRARTLEKYKWGRSPIQYANQFYSTELPQVSATQAVRTLLAIDGYARAIHGDIDGGLQSARAILGVGRSLGDEPPPVSQISRFFVQYIAADLIAFVLAQGDATEPALAATQTALANEAEPSQLLIALRGERAGQFDVCDKVAAGKINMLALAEPNPGEHKPDGIERPEHRVSQAVDLHMLTMAVEIGKKATWEQGVLWDDWARQVRALSEDRPGRPVLAAVQLPATSGAFPSYAKARSLLIACETIIGFERIRLARGRWPKPGESLLPVFPHGLPVDPLSEKPIVWKATELELLVYSFGLDQKDNGGNLDNKRSYLPGTDLGYCLKKAADRRGCDLFSRQVTPQFLLVGACAVGGPTRGVLPRGRGTDLAGRRRAAGR